MEISEEEVIRHEAFNFYQNERSEKGANFSFAYNEPRSFNIELKKRLEDFISTESKVYFLDELLNLHKNASAKLLGQQIHSQEKRQKYTYNLDASLFYINQLIRELPTLVKKSDIINNTNVRNSIFVSYSHCDVETVNSFKRHFKPLERNQNIDLWDDSKIFPGQKWKDEIKLAIQKAKIAIFVLSADFFASEFIANEELPELLKSANEEGATILSIIAKPCDFKNSQLSIYQAMNDPNNTLLSMSELHKEELWVNLVTQVRRVLDLK